MSSPWSEDEKRGIVGDADAPLGYMVDPNHRPNPLDMGSVRTDGVTGRSEYDLKHYTPIFDGGQQIEANAVASGHTPVADLPQAEGMYEPPDLPSAPSIPPPAAATDYMPDPANVDAPLAYEKTEEEESDQEFEEEEKAFEAGLSPEPPKPRKAAAKKAAAIKEVTPPSPKAALPAAGETPEATTGVVEPPQADQAPAGDAGAQSGPSDTPAPLEGSEPPQGGDPGQSGNQSQALIVTQADAGGSQST